jgi:hypothetical protein
MKKCQILGQTFEIGGFISHNAEKVVKTTSPDKNIPSHNMAVEMKEELDLFCPKWDSAWDKNTI